MKSQFLHTLNDSFRSWFDHELTTEGRAFRNVSGQLYRVKDDKFPNLGIYSNPYGQFIFDSSIPSANVPSGVFINGVFTPKGTNGLILDYNGGRAIFNTPVNGTITASYAAKDFNIYSTTKSDAELIFAAKNQFRPKYEVPVTGVPSNAVFGPMIYLKRDSAFNEPFALGGQDNTKTQYRAIVLTDNDYDLDGVGSIFMDASEKSFMLLNTPPLNRYGDIYSGNSYNYLNDVAANYNNTNLVYINDVDFYRFDSTTETSLGSQFHVGFIEFSLELPRFPRIS